MSFFCPVFALVIRAITKNGYQGLANQTSPFPRDEAIQFIIDNMVVSRATIIQSPPVSGTTSLLQILETKLVPTGWCVKHIRLQIDRDPYELLKCYGGIDFRTGCIEEQLKTSPTCIMLDDAQNAFGEEHSGFWNTLLKQVDLPGGIRFVIASTYFIGGKESPVEFASFPSISPV